MNVYAKQTQTHRENQWFPVGRGRGGGARQGEGSKRYVQTTMYKVDKQKGYIV